MICHSFRTHSHQTQPRVERIERGRTRTGRGGNYQPWTDVYPCGIGNSGDLRRTVHLCKEETSLPPRHGGVKSWGPFRPSKLVLQVRLLKVELGRISIEVQRHIQEGRRTPPSTETESLKTLSLSVQRESLVRGSLVLSFSTTTQTYQW